MKKINPLTLTFLFFIACSAIVLAATAPGDIRGLGGKCLDVDHQGTEDGTQIQIWECNGTKAQKWSLEKGQIRGFAGKCLDVDHQGTEDGTKIQLWECNGSAAQKWALSR